MFRFAALCKQYSCPEANVYHYYALQQPFPVFALYQTFPVRTTINLTLSSTSQCVTITNNSSHSLHCTLTFHLPILIILLLVTTATYHHHHSTIIVINTVNHHLPYPRPVSQSVFIIQYHHCPLPIITLNTTNQHKKPQQNNYCFTIRHHKPSLISSSNNHQRSLQCITRKSSMVNWIQSSPITTTTIPSNSHYSTIAQEPGKVTQCNPVLVTRL